MYGHKGVPNRWRVDRYRQLVDAQGFRVVKLAVTTLAEPSDIAEVRPRLAAPIRTLSDEDLSWLGFWLLVRKESNKEDKDERQSASCTFLITPSRCTAAT